MTIIIATTRCIIWDYSSMLLLFWLLRRCHWCGWCGTVLLLDEGMEHIEWIIIIRRYIIRRRRWSSRRRCRGCCGRRSEWIEEVAWIVGHGWCRRPIGAVVATIVVVWVARVVRHDGPSTTTLTPTRKKMREAIGAPPLSTAAVELSSTRNSWRNRLTELYRLKVALIDSNNELQILSTRKQLLTLFFYSENYDIYDHSAKIGSTE